jgi:hypothetical protein
MSDPRVDFIRYWHTCTPEEQAALRREIEGLSKVHPVELQLNASAYEIMDAIAHGSDLIQRGIRGIIADKAFHRYIIPRLVNQGWISEAIHGDQSYDAALSRDGVRVTIQVKMQRKKLGKPMTAKSRSFQDGSDFWVVETQRTRAGKDADGGATRPYRFGEFDILAVNLQASSSDWSKFMYTVGAWLVPQPNDSRAIRTLQPVSQTSNDDWTDSFEECVRWLARNDARTIRHA